MQEKKTPPPQEIVKPNFLIVVGAFGAVLLVLVVLVFVVTDPFGTSFLETDGEANRESSEESIMESMQKMMREMEGGSSLYWVTTQRLLTFDDLEGRSIDQLRMLRNEVFARHGWVFDDPGLRAHFERLPWYQPGKDNDMAARSLSPVENENVRFLNLIERGFEGMPIQEMYDVLMTHGGDFSLLHESTARVETPGDGFLSLRDAPGLKSMELARIPHGSMVLVLDFSDHWDQIYGQQGQWFLVEHRGEVGWAWGWLLIKTN